jgi:hypothetical protein
MRTLESSAIRLATGLVVLLSGLAPAPATAPGRQAEGATPAIWRDPGEVEKLDLATGPGGSEHAPKPPFKFVEEDRSGTNPKVRVVDANGARWTVKFGREVRADVFASRLAWAAGYFVEPSYFVPEGRIEGAGKLDRARRFVDKDGRFRDARFELKDDAVKKLGDDRSWAWDDNPFVGKHELAGLKILTMLTSNWDSKDVRLYKQNGSNTAIYVVGTPNGDEARYVVTDWGGTMGRWGVAGGNWSTWDCQGYAKQTPDFVKGVESGAVRWGYEGQRADAVAAGIRVEDVVWALQYLGRITDEQLHAALRASGASPAEEDCFATAVRARIDALRRLQPQPEPTST